MERPPDSLKQLSDRLARQLSTGTGADTARLSRLLPFAQLPPDTGGAAREQPDGNRVGIWKRDRSLGADVFVRDKDLRQDWHLWANKGRIPAKGSARRVVLLGESVARGYLYDPAYNPASVLTGILGAHLGRGAVEVVDLARTSLGMDIREVAVDAAALRPDAVVLFCGNNWRYESPRGPLASASLAAALRERGAAGYRAYAEESLRLRAERTVDEVSGFYAQLGVPVLWIAPEFNLADWRDPVTNAPHLPGDGNRRWLAERSAARAALVAGDYRAAEEAARAMMEADQGTGVAGPYLLAECRQAAGDLEGARSALEAARDASVWDTTVLYAPRSSAVVLNALRERSRAHGDLLVDCPDLFREHLDGGIPGRRMFLDYCHLTSEAIRVTMAAAAAALLGALKEDPADWRELLPLAAEPSARVESEARFLAAVHNAHWWQGGELVEDGVRESVGRSAHIVPVMAAFLDQQARRTPPVMCRSAEALLAAGSPQIEQYLLGGDHQSLDPLIAGAISRSLRAVGEGAGVERLWVEQHGVRRRLTDLLDYYYLAAARQPHEVEWVRPGVPPRDRDYYKAFSPSSVFCFVGEAGQPVTLDLTWRTPHPPPTTAEVRIRVNGRPVGGMPVAAGWERYEIALSGESVCDGLNEVVLDWPVPDFPGSAAVEALSDAVIAGRAPDLYCSFGDVHMFTARAGQPERSA